MRRRGDVRERHARPGDPVMPFQQEGHVVQMHADVLAPGLEA